MKESPRSVYDEALPLLQERGLPGAAFVVTGLLDTDEPYWWTEVEALAASEGPALVRRLKQVPDDERLATIADLRRVASSPAPRVANLRRTELRALESAGIAVGNHSHTHPCLPRCRDEKIRSEVADAHAALVDALGHAPTAFAYPNGRPADYTAETKALLRRNGFTVAFSTSEGIVGRDTDWMAVKRLPGDGLQAHEFAWFASGLGR